MPGLPSGTVTFLFTDIEGSTRLLQRLGDRYGGMLAEYRQLLRTIVQDRGGKEVDTQGDALFVAFQSAKDAVAAAVAAQRAIITRAWPDGASLQVRMGLHTGEALAADTGYVGLDVHRAARICAAGHGGQILLSQTTRDLTIEGVPPGTGFRDLGEHRLKDLAQPQRLFQLLAADLPADFPPLTSLSIVPNNLPILLTSFIGREQEISEVMRLLATARLLTLTGSGGSGKTRLALQIGAELQGDFPDGVWLVELAALSDATLVPQTVSAALRLPQQPGRSVSDALADYLRPKRLLLILDNCEHVLLPCAQLTDSLLQACSNLRVLATSREALGIPGEAIRRVPSLSFPGSNEPSSEPNLWQYDGTRLFIERASLTEPSFAVTSSNAPAILQVCRRLEGIPLAIELAAARVKVLTAEQIAAHLDDRFRLLTGGSRTTLPRHQTMRAAIDWSYDLLREKERTLFRRLSVFATGWTLEAAEAICAGEGVGAADILDLLTTLVDKSLVAMEPQAGEARYHLLETMRQYAREKLLASPEAHKIRDRHRGWYLAFAERADPELRGPHQGTWLRRLDAEYDNLRAALESSLGEGEDAEHALKLTGALHWFWYTRGYTSEGLRWLEAAISKKGAGSIAARERALRGAAMMAWRLDEYKQSRELLQQSLALSEQLQDKWANGSSLHHLGHLAEAQGDFARAATHFEESLRLFRETQSTWGTAWSLNCLARTLIDQGTVEQAVPLYEESLALCRAVGDKWLLAHPLAGLGTVADVRGDYDRATALLQESLTLMRETGHRGGIASTMLKLGHVAFKQGFPKRAATLYHDSLARRREIGDKRGAALCLARLAEVAVTKGDLKRTAQLLGAADALLYSIGAPLSRPDFLDLERTASAARRTLGNEEFNAAYAEGRRMNWHQAVEYALGDNQ